MLEFSSQSKHVDFLWSEVIFDSNSSITSYYFSASSVMAILSYNDIFLRAGRAVCVAV
jgi:hypothetical protein